MISQAQIWGVLGEKSSREGLQDINLLLVDVFFWATTWAPYFQKVKAAADPKEYHFAGTETQDTVLRCLVRHLQ